MSEVFAYVRREGVLRIARPGMQWLSTGANGGFVCADAAYNVTVPEEFKRTDLTTYAAERRREASFDAVGPTLFTSVPQTHARAARAGPVEVVATVGLSNPAALPIALGGGTPTGSSDSDDGEGDASRRYRGPGTVNIIAGIEYALDDGALAELVAVLAEAKAATLLSVTRFPGTTTDAVAAGCDPAGDPAAFAGSSTVVGEAARACVREAVHASFRSRYRDERPPATVTEARYGLITDEPADVFRPG